MSTFLEVYRKAPSAIRQTHIFMFVVFCAATAFWTMAPNWPVLVLLLIMVAMMMYHYSELKKLVARLDELREEVRALENDL